MGLFSQIRSMFGKGGPTAVVDAATQSLQPERRAARRVNPRPGIRALIIDDSPTVIAVLRKMLHSVGVIALEAPDAEKGVFLAHTEKPDLIFLDIVMPGMNGFAALRVLRRDPVTKLIPVIMISGNELATEEFYANRIGADDFMKKPFGRSEVFTRIERLLDADRVPRRQGVQQMPVSEPMSA